MSFIFLNVFRVDGGRNAQIYDEGRRLGRLLEQSKQFFDVEKKNFFLRSRNSFFTVFSLLRVDPPRLLGKNAQSTQIDRRAQFPDSHWATDQARPELHLGLYTHFSASRRAMRRRRCCCVALCGSFVFAGVSSSGQPTLTEENFFP